MSLSIPRPAPISPPPPFLSLSRVLFLKEENGRYTPAHASDVSFKLAGPGSPNVLSSSFFLPFLFCPVLVFLYRHKTSLLKFPFSSAVSRRVALSELSEVDPHRLKDCLPHWSFLVGLDLRMTFACLTFPPFYLPCVFNVFPWTDYLINTTWSCTNPFSTPIAPQFFLFLTMLVNRVVQS